MRGKRLIASVALMGVMLAAIWSPGTAQGTDTDGGASTSLGTGAAPQALAGSGFTYQGRLDRGGNPYSGTCDFRFSLYDALSGGSQVGSTQTSGGVNVQDGLFTVAVNAGNEFGAGAFTGEGRWLAIQVQCAGDGGYTALEPRQELTPAPYALALPGLRTEQNTTSPNVIGGYEGNSVADGMVGATIGGGGSFFYPNQVLEDYATVGGGRSNTASGHSSTVGGGGGNSAVFGSATVGGGLGNTADGPAATVGGGSSNTADADYATVSGGTGNTARGYYATVGGGIVNSTDADCATVGGGGSNTASALYATVGGGHSNTADADYATVSGGTGNTASALYTTVGGGYHNSASHNDATVGGGWENVASGSASTVPGGDSNLAAGDDSFAAGRRAKANSKGCFVWGDSTDADVTCDNDDRWVARASGGVYFYTSAGLSSYVYVPAGGNSWNGVSDRATKENFASADGQAILERLASLPVQEYNLKSQDPSIRHVGLVAQDFAAFGYGESDTAINMQDADGVAMAAIQALYAQNQALQADNANLEARVAALEAGSSGSGPSAWQVGLLPTGGLLAVGLAWVARRGERG